MRGADGNWTLTGARAHDVAGDALRTQTMLHAWLISNMDTRRSISLLIVAAGFVLIVLAMAASPVPLSPDGVVTSTIGPIIGAAVGGSLRSRLLGRGRALGWAVAYGVSVALLLAAMFATVALVRPAARDVQVLVDAWPAVIVSGFAVGFAGAFLWERDVQARRFGAVALPGVCLVVGAFFAGTSGEPWALLGAPALLAGGALILFAFLFRRPSFLRGSAGSAI